MKKSIIGGMAAIGLLAATMNLKAAETNYAAADGSIIYNSLGGSYTLNPLYATAYANFISYAETKRALVEYSVSTLTTNITSARLVITVSASVYSTTNYGFILYAYTNGNGTINNADYGCDATALGSVCSNLNPETDVKFTNDVTATIINAITNGCAYVGFRIQPHIDPLINYELRFVNGESGNGPYLLLEYTTPSVNNAAGASAVTTNSATLNGTLVSTGAAPTYVKVCWGPTDGVTNFSDWTNTAPVGPLPAGAFSTNISGLTTGTVYYYRCFASNSFGEAWASATTNFTTLSVAPPGTLQLATNAYSVNENAGSVTVTVTRAEGTNGAATVQYATSNLTAIAGTHYTATNGTLAWEAGESSAKAFQVVIMNDGLYSGTNRTFAILLNNATVAALGTPNTATVTIAESTPGTLQFATNAYSVNENDGSVTVTVTRAGGSNGPATVQYATVNGSAVAGTNYTATNGALAWAHGESGGKPVVVPILNDGAGAGKQAPATNKLFSIILSNATAAALAAPGTATVTIAQASPGALQFSAAAVSVNQDAGSVTLTVTRAGGSNGPATVQFATVNGTAVAGTDYTATNGALSWAGGDSGGKSVVVPILDDGTYTADKVFTVALGSATGAALAAPGTATVTIVEGNPGALQFSAAAVSVSENAGSATLAVTRAGGSNGPATVAYATADGTAAAGTHYTAASGTLAWSHGETAVKTFAVPILNNTQSDSDKTFSAGLSAATGAALGAPATETVTILEDDPPPSPPAAPAGLAASQGTWTNKVQLTWNASSGATSYAVYRNTVNDSASATAFGTEPATAAYDDTAVTAGKIYYYWVKAKNSAGASAFSAGASGYASQVVITVVSPLAADFDGDGKCDPALYETAGGAWHIKLSASGYGLVTLPFGGTGYAAVARDFDGDGKADPTLYHAATGIWQIKLSNNGYSVATMSTFGGSLCSPAAGDYDGDGKADPAIYDSVNSQWQVAMSSAGYAVQGVTGFGGTGRAAVEQNYDSDHRFDAAIYNQTNGNWTVLLSAQNYITATLWAFGGAGCEPVKGDFDGDGLADPAIYEAASGKWQVKVSGSGYATATLTGFGGTGYAVSAADYDGDGKADPILLNLATGAWRIKLSGSGYTEASLASGWTP